MPAPAPEASSAAAPRPARIERPPSPFDCAHSSRASHEPEDFDGLTRTARRARVPNRHGVSAIEHPTDTALTSSVRSVDRDGRKTWPMDSDAVEGRRGSAWLTVAVEKPRRTIGTIRDALAGRDSRSGMGGSGRRYPNGLPQTHISLKGARDR